MKTFFSIATVLAFAASAPLWSQEVVHRRVAVAGATSVEAGNVMTWSAVGPPGDAVSLHGPGIRFEGPPKKGAPYSAEAVTESVQALTDGNRIRRETRSKIYRDSEGRTRREEKLDAVGPWAVAGESPTRIFINDPVAGEHWVLEPENKVAHKMKLPSFEEHIGIATNVDVNVDLAVEAAEGATGPATFTRRIEERRMPMPVGAGVAAMAMPVDQPNVEDLGTRMIEGVEAKGSKITREIPAGEIGNERPIEVVFEQWRSEALGVDVMTKRSDPRSAETTYKLTNIQQTEPLPSMFQPPPDYEVKDGGDQIFMRKVMKTESK